jgi:adenine-specific DNA-methyltransferase
MEPAYDGRKVILGTMATDLKKLGEAKAAEEPEPLDLRSMDVTDEKRHELLRLFPEVRTEGGKIDFDRLRLALGETIDGGRERYGMTWPGKADCFRTIQTPSIGTLLPNREESVNFDTTENLIIEGDNLEVLKLLQKSYLGKIKMIYIDPPYNTGNDFIYPDNYSESLQTYLEYTGQVDDEGRKFGTNTETDGRFHSKWMNMMYPRIYLARNLLCEDGVIFVSIDDREAINLRRVMDDVFGEENFVEQIIWKNKYNAGALTTGFSNIHEYIVCFSRTPIKNISTSLDEDSIAEYKGKDSKYAARGGFVTQPLATASKDDRPNLVYPIVIDGREIWPDKQWIWSKDRVEEAISRDEVVVNESKGKISVRVKQYLRDESGQVRKTKPLSIFVGPYNQVGSKEIEALFGESVFDFPKPSSLVRSLLSIVVNEKNSSNDIVLDFFAGSGATAHAVLDLNRQDDGNRKFILVQLPEPTRRDDYKTVADITKERVRRVIKKLDEEDAGKLDLNGGEKQARGFRVFKLAESNLKTWNADAPEGEESLAEQLELHVDHIRPGRTPEDILFEILLKSGYPLTAKVGTLELAGKKVFSIAEGALLVCLEQELTMEVIRAMADRKPERVVCLDAGFHGNDQLKANAVQIFKTLHGRGDDAKESSDVTVFRTV